MSFIALMATLLDSHTSTSSSLLTGPSHPHSSAFFHPSGALSRLLGWAQQSASPTYGCHRLHREHFVSIFFLPVASPPTVRRVRPLRALRLFQLALSFEFSSSNAFICSRSLDSSSVWLLDHLSVAVGLFLQLLLRGVDYLGESLTNLTIDLL